MKTKNKKQEDKKEQKNLKKNICEYLRISVEKITVYNDIVCEFPLCTFNLLDQVVISPGCSYEFKVVYVQREQ